MGQCVTRACRTAARAALAARAARAAAAIAAAAAANAAAGIAAAAGAAAAAAPPPSSRRRRRKKVALPAISGLALTLVCRSASIMAVYSAVCFAYVCGDIALTCPLKYHASMSPSGRLGVSAENIEAARCIRASRSSA